MHRHILVEVIFAVQCFPISASIHLTKTKKPLHCKKGTGPPDSNLVAPLTPHVELGYIFKRNAVTLLSFHQAFKK